MIAQQRRDTKFRLRMYACMRECMSACLYLYDFSFPYYIFPQNSFQIKPDYTQFLI